MRGDENTRPVWLTREQTNAISRLLVDYDQRGIWNPMLTVPIGDILVAWDAAPADAAEAIAHGLRKGGWENATADSDDVGIVLRALGQPETSA